MRALAAFVLVLSLAAPAYSGARAVAQDPLSAPLQSAHAVLEPFPAGSGAVLRGEIEAERDRGIARILTILGDRAPRDPTVRFRVYASAEDKGARTGDARWAHLEEGNATLHVVVNGEVRGDRLGLDATLLFGRALGAPALPLLERGVAAFHARDWGGRGIGYWAARLRRASLVPPLARVLSPDWADEESPLIVTPTAGVLVEYLLARWSRTGFVDRYADWEPDTEEIAGLEAGWQYHLDRLLSTNGPAIEADLTEARTRRLAGLPQALGFNYSHEGYGRYDGYLSERSDASIARMARLGASGAAILPYAFMASSTPPTSLRPPTRLGAETDEAVIRAIRSAQREGLTVLLKPHIWLRGSWPGEIEFRSRRDWEQFFDEYERWILHYALLGEIHGVPVLSVGVELSRATRGREARWGEIVHRVRSVYSGSLVYAANWGDEFEKLGFWKLFDYLGVDAYYPLSEDPEASDEALLRGAEAMLDRIEAVSRRHDRRVLLTEIGFASTPGPWVRPWEGHLAEGRSGTDQLRSYRAVMAAMEGRDWIAGVFWWKWPSDLRSALRDRRGFIPAGKPAEAVLGQWFRGGHGLTTISGGP